MEITSMDILNYIVSIPNILLFILVGIGVIVGYLASSLVGALDYVCDYFKARKKSNSIKSDEET